MTPQNLSESDAPAPNIAQVDPPRDVGGWAARALVAALILCIGIAAYVHFGRKKTTATGDVARISLYPIHSQISGDGPGPGMKGEAEQYDQLLVFAQVHIHNVSPQPITMTELRGDVVLANPPEPDQPEVTSRAASPRDFARLFGAYPRLAPLRMDPLARGTTIAPGQTAEGLMIFNYSMTKDAWDTRKKFTVVVSFSNNSVLQIDGTHS